MDTKDLTRAERRDLKKLQRTECWKKFQKRYQETEAARIKLAKELSSTQEKVTQLEESLKTQQEAHKKVTKVQNIADLFKDDGTSGEDFVLIPREVATEAGIKQN